MAENAGYTGIETLDGLMGVRTRLSMYLDSTGVVEDGHQPRALTQMMQEAVSNALDERLAGYGDEVTVTIHKDGSMEVTDHGRGIPKGPGKSFDDAIRALTVTHSSGKFSEGAYAACGTAGMNGIGVKAINAGSKKLEIHAVSHETKLNADGEKEFTGKLEEWQLVLHLEEVLKQRLIKSGINPSTRETGTSLRFWPDDGPISDTNDKPVLESVYWELDDIKPVLDAAAVLMPGLRVTLTDLREGEPQTFEWVYENGLQTYVKTLCEGMEGLRGFKEPVQMSGVSTVRRGGNGYELGMTYAFFPTESIGCVMKAFANGVPTSKGGYHLDGLKAGFLKAVNEFAKTTRKGAKAQFDVDDVFDGLTIAFEMKVPAAIVEFEGQTKSKLSTAQAKPAAQDIAYNTMIAWLHDNPKLADALIGRALDSFASRKAAMKARADAKSARTEGGKKLLVSSKLKTCTSRDPKKRELYLTEGDSASNIGRDVTYQAVMPLRGKILNVVKPKVTLARAKENVEISTIISVLGAGVSSSFDVDALQYDKVILCMDSDADGSHIRMLLVGLFWKLFPGLIEAGKLYYVDTPLYRATKYVKGILKERLFYTEEEYEKHRREVEGWKLSRFKGLGEIDNVDDARAMMCDPETRHLVRIDLGDAVEAQKTVMAMLGDDASLRYSFIEKNVDFDSFEE